jgi:hypothetical protein
MNHNLFSIDCFTIDKITLGNISIDDIKFSLPSNNQKDIDYYNKNKDNILNGKFKMLSFNDKYYNILFKRYSENFSLLTKISFSFLRDLISLIK